MSRSPLNSLCRILLVGIALVVAGCSSSSDDTDKYEGIPVEKLYNQAMDSLSAKEWDDSTKEFDAVDRQYPTSVWATKAELMGAYTRYEDNKLDDAVTQLDRFIQLHPGNKDIAYAYYLKAVCYYEQIEDVDRDQGAAEQAVTALQEVITRFPNSIYARDSQFKLVTVRDHLAGRDMAVGRFYESQREFSSAIGRYRAVLDRYQTTTQVPEALYRLVECYEALGITDEAARNAAVLGYNYPGSPWYAAAYNLLNKLSPDVVARMTPGSATPAIANDLSMPGAPLEAAQPVPASATTSESASGSWFGGLLDIFHSGSTAKPAGTEPAAPAVDKTTTVPPPGTSQTPAPAAADSAPKPAEPQSAVPSVQSSASPISSEPSAQPAEPTPASNTGGTAPSNAPGDASQGTVQPPGGDSGLFSWIHKFW